MSEDIYAKLDHRIVYSSIWDEDGDTCKVWITFLALKNPHTGIVDKNITGIARICKLPIEKVEEAVRKFESPDPRSSSKDHEGRKLLPVERGWLVVNNDLYMGLGWSDEKKEYERRRKAEYRARKNHDGGRSEPPKKEEPDPAVKQADPDIRESSCLLLNLINEISGKQFRPAASNLEPIQNRLKESGVDFEGCVKMVRRQWQLWKDDFTTDGKPMREYFQPTTLFRVSKFDGYYAARDLPITSRQPQKTTPEANQIQEKITVRSI